jgi:hypothetical protein
VSFLALPAVPRSRSARLLFLALLPAGLAVLAWLGIALFDEALARGGLDLWLTLWLLAFLVGLPALVVVLAVAGTLQAQRRWHRIVPNTGKNIPGAEQ